MSNPKLLVDSLTHYAKESLHYKTCIGKRKQSYVTYGNHYNINEPCNIPKKLWIKASLDLKHGGRLRGHGKAQLKVYFHAPGFCPGSPSNLLLPNGEQLQTAIRSHHISLRRLIEACRNEIKGLRTLKQMLIVRVQSRSNSSNAACAGIISNHSLFLHGEY